jgi:hypothetical protein
MDVKGFSQTPSRLSFRRAAFLPPRTLTPIRPRKSPKRGTSGIMDD